jgi:hypothetical protein
MTTASSVRDLLAKLREQISDAEDELHLWEEYADDPGCEDALVKVEGAIDDLYNDLGFELDGDFDPSLDFSSVKETVQDLITEVSNAWTNLRETLESAREDLPGILDSVMCQIGPLAYADDDQKEDDHG